MRNVARGGLAALAVGMMLTAGAAASHPTRSASSTKLSFSTRNDGVCDAIDGNFDYLESISKSPSLTILIESREQAALDMNGCDRIYKG